MIKFTIGALAPLIAAANKSGVPETCLGQTDILGYEHNVGVSVPYFSNYEEIKSLKPENMAFARAKQIEICHDSDAGVIHGVTMTIMVHEPTMKEEDELEFNDLEMTALHLAELKRTVDDGEMYKLDTLGRETFTCGYIFINDKDRIKSVQFHSIVGVLRGVTFNLIGGFSHHYGMQVLGREIDGLETTSYDFSEHIDVLGFEASVRTNESLGEVIVGLGFVYNECPVRDYLEWETEQYQKPSSKLRSMEEIAIATSEDNIVGPVIVTVVVLFLAVTLLYCCLKNRGKMFKNSDQAAAKKDGPKLPVAQNSLQMTDLNADLGVTENGADIVKNSEVQI